MANLACHDAWPQYIESKVFLFSRGTANFTIKASKTEDGRYTTILNGLLEQALSSTWYCSVPIARFDLASPIQARFIEFHILSHYSNAGGLQYLEVIVDEGKIIG